jgi:hypothetical protein
MKKTLLSLAILSAALVSNAQGSIDFIVQIPAGTPCTAVDVTGNFIDDAGLGTDWSSGLSLTNAGGTWAGTANVVPPGNYEYKFRYYNGATQNWEAVPSTCATNTNRAVTVTGGASTTAGPFCISTCDPSCATYSPVNLKLTLDMNNVDRTIPAGCTVLDSISVAGDFGADAGATNWSPGALGMTEVLPGSKVYTKTITVLNKYYEYKFVKATGWDCTIAPTTYQFSEQKDSFNVAVCLNSTSGNRYIDLSTAAANSTVEVSYKWQSCSVAGPASIKYLYNASNASVAPNPFAGNTTLNFSKPEHVQHVRIINSMGQLVVSYGKINGSKLVLAGLSNGTYLAQVLNKDGSRETLKLTAQ